MANWGKDYRKMPSPVSKGLSVRHRVDGPAKSNKRSSYQKHGGAHLGSGAGEMLPGSYYLRRLIPNAIHEVSQSMKKDEGTRKGRGFAVAGTCSVCGNVFRSNGNNGLGPDGTCRSKTACAKRMEPPQGDECYECDHRHLGTRCRGKGCGCPKWVYGPSA